MGLGGFAAGIVQGVQTGVATRKAQMELQQMQRIQTAAKNRQKALIASLSGDPGAHPLVPPAPMPQMGPGPTPAPGGQPPAGGAPPGQGAQLQALSGGGPQAAPAGQNPAAGGPSPSPSPQTPPQPPNAAGGAPAGAGGPQGDSPAFDMQRVAQDYTQLKKLAMDDYRQTAKRIYDSQPGKKWKPTEFIDAVDSEFDSESKLDPDLKQAVLAESAAARAEASYKQAQLRAITSERNTDANIASRERGQDMTFQEREDAITASLKRQSMADSTRLAAAQIAQAGANHRAEEYVDQRDRALAAGLSEKEWQAGVAAELKQQGFSDAYIESIFKTQAGTMGTTSAPPAAARAAIPAPPALPTGRGGAPKPTPPKVGAVEGGYRFKGGDPADKKNWVKVAAGG